VGYFAQPFDPAKFKVTNHAVAPLVVIEGPFFPAYFWSSDGTKYEQCVAIVRTTSTHVQMEAASEVDHSEPVDLTFYEATLSDKSVRGWTDSVEHPFADDAKVRPV